MEISIPAAEVAAYSMILTYAIDFLSKVPALNKVVTGVGKQILAVIIGIIFCVYSNISVFTEDTRGEVLTGLAIAAMAGMAVAKGAEYIKAKKDTAVNTNKFRVGVTGSTGATGSNGTCPEYTE